MNNLKNCGVYFANIQSTKTLSDQRCQNLNCNYQHCNGCNIEPVIIWTQTPDHKSLVIPITKVSVEDHELSLGSLPDNYALINLKETSNNKILNFYANNVCYADLKRLTWIKNYRITSEYLIDGELRVLTSAELHDFSLRITTLPVSNMTIITTNTTTRNLKNQIINPASVSVVYNNEKLKE